MVCPCGGATGGTGRRGSKQAGGTCVPPACRANRRSGPIAGVGCGMMLVLASGSPPLLLNQEEARLPQAVARPALPRWWCPAGWDGRALRHIPQGRALQAEAQARLRAWVRFPVVERPARVTCRWTGMCPRFVAGGGRLRGAVAAGRSRGGGTNGRLVEHRGNTPAPARAAWGRTWRRATL